MAAAAALSTQTMHRGHVDVHIWPPWQPLHPRHGLVPARGTGAARSVAPETTTERWVLQQDWLRAAGSPSQRQELSCASKAVSSASSGTCSLCSAELKRTIQRVAAASHMSLNRSRASGQTLRICNAAAIRTWRRLAG